MRLGLRIVDELAAVLPIRVGMHSGSAVQRAGDWFGAAVNLASRVSAAAAGGEVLVTDVTWAACGRSLRDVELRSRGLMAFKNVELPVPVSVARACAPQPAPSRPAVVERLVPHPAPAAGLQPA